MPVGRRLGWGLADQALSSVGNLALALVVAHSLGVEAFGAFGAAYAAYQLALSVNRAVAADPLVVVHAAGREIMVVARAAAGASIVLGLVLAVPVTVAALVLDGPLHTALLVLAPLLPGLLLQDLWRYAFSADGSPRKAFLNDLLWTATQALVIAGLLASGHLSLVSVLLAWGGAAALAAVAALGQGARVPQPGRAVVWLQDHRRWWPRYLVELLTTTGAWQGVLYAVGAVAGLGALAAIRGVQVLYGVLHVAYRAALLVLVPEGVVRWGSGHDLRRKVSFLMGGLAAIACAWALLLVLVPDGLGDRVLGDTWAVSEPLVLPFGLFMATMGVAEASAIGLRIAGAAAAGARTALATGPALVAASAVGARLDGAVGAATWLVLAGAISAVVWRRAFIRATELPTERVLCTLT